MDDRDLFTDGWRELGDDTERLAGYILLALGGIAGVALAAYGVALWVNPRLCGCERPSPHTSVAALCTLFIVVGLLMAGGVVAFFRQERRHWDLRGLNAERIVAGGFLFGFALLFIAFQMGQSSQGDARPFLIAAGLGVSDLVLFLAIGLAFAYAPRLRPKRRLRAVYVMRRYALDDKLNELDDPASPYADGLCPLVVLRNPDGTCQTYHPTPAVWDLAEPGTGATAIVKGKELIALTGLRRR